MEKITCWASVKRTLADGSVVVERCRKSPMHGQRVCDTHGGRSPKAREAAETRLTNILIEKTLLRFGVASDSDPQTILLEQVKVAHGNALVLQEMLKDVAPEDVASDDPQTRARARGILNLSAEWSDRAAAMSATALRAGIEQKMVRLAEVQAAPLLMAIRNGIEEAGLDEETKGRLFTEISKSMRTLAAG
jgi:hypothetical protein